MIGIEVLKILKYNIGIWRQGTAPKARFEPITGALQCPEILSGHSYFLGSYLSYTIDYQGIN
eukprot:scaffold33778_cov176-Skeletonema_dohrnii-CCMP3373.AAC.1